VEMTKWTDMLKQELKQFYSWYVRFMYYGWQIQSILWWDGRTRSSSRKTTYSRLTIW
jgi:hypothetical protein